MTFHSLPRDHQPRWQELRTSLPTSAHSFTFKKKEKAPLVSYTIKSPTFNATSSSFNTVLLSTSPQPLHGVNTTVVAIMGAACKFSVHHKYNIRIPIDRSLATHILREYELSAPPPGANTLLDRVEAGIFQKAIQSTGNMANSKQDIKDQKEIPKMPKAMRERLELELKNHAKHKAEVQAQQKAAKKKEHTKSNGNNVSSGKDGEPEKKLGKKARKT